VGVGGTVAVGVGRGVVVATTMRVSSGRGVISGCGGMLTHAANPINNKMNPIHFALLTSHTHTSN
jgi:hypothetical protein